MPPPPLWAAACLLALLLLFVGARRRARGAEGFRVGARERAVAGAAAAAFRGGDLSLAGLRARAADADAADLAVARRLWRAGRLSPEAFAAASE